MPGQLRRRCATADGHRLVELSAGGDDAVQQSFSHGGIHDLDQHRAGSSLELGVAGDLDRPVARGDLSEEVVACLASPERVRAGLGFALGRLLCLDARLVQGFDARFVVLVEVGFERPDRLGVRSVEAGDVFRVLVGVPLVQVTSQLVQDVETLRGSQFRLSLVVVLDRFPERHRGIRTQQSGDRLALGYLPADLLPARGGDVPADR